MRYIIDSYFKGHGFIENLRAFGGIGVCWTCDIPRQLRDNTSQQFFSMLDVTD